MFRCHLQVYSELWHLVRLMCQWRNELEITILPPYVPTDEEKSTPKLYAENVRAQMAKAVDMLPYTQTHTQFLALKKLKVRLWLRWWITPFGARGTVASKAGLAS